MHGRLRLIFDAPDMKTARRRLYKTIEVFSDRAPGVVEKLEEGFEDAMAVMALSER